MAYINVKHPSILEVQPKNIHRKRQKQHSNNLKWLMMCQTKNKRRKTLRNNNGKKKWAEEVKKREISKMKIKKKKENTRKILRIFLRFVYERHNIKNCLFDEKFGRSFFYGRYKYKFAQITSK